MRARLLRKIRRQAHRELTISSITRNGQGIITGMSYRYDDPIYRNVFSFGNTEQEVITKVEHIYYFEKKRNRLLDKYK